MIAYQEQVQAEKFKRQKELERKKELQEK